MNQKRRIPSRSHTWTKDEQWYRNIKDLWTARDPFELKSCTSRGLVLMWGSLLTRGRPSREVA